MARDIYGNELRRKTRACRVRVKLRDGKKVYFTVTSTADQSDQSVIDWVAAQNRDIIEVTIINGGK